MDVLDLRKKGAIGVDLRRSGTFRSGGIILVVKRVLYREIVAAEALEAPEPVSLSGRQRRANRKTE